MQSIDRVIKGAVESSDIISSLSTPVGALTPRQDQIDTASSVLRWLAEPADKGKIVEMPTGGGKTMLANMVIRWLIANTAGVNVAFLVSRTELLVQTKSAIEKSFGKGSVNITQGARHTNHAGARVRVLMEQTIASRIKKGTASSVVEAIEKADVVFIDECHHTYYQSFIDHLLETGARVIGLSATPDDWRLLPWFEQTKILGVSQLELECADPRVLATPVMLFYSGESTMKWAMAGLGSEESEKVRYGLVKNTIASEIRAAEERVKKERADKNLPPLPYRSLNWMVKVTRKAHATDLAEHLTEQGIPAKAFISGGGGGTKAEIDRIFAGKSHHRVAIVVHRFTVGYDHPGIQGLIFTNETGYPSFVQSVGRVLRTGYPPQKDEAYILDMAGNWSLHKEKYMERRESPSPLIPIKVEKETNEEGGGFKDGPGRPDAIALGNMAVLTLPGIQNTEYHRVNRAKLLAWCAVDGWNYVKSEPYTRFHSDQPGGKEEALKRALSSYWFLTGENIIKGAMCFKQRKEQANAIVMGDPEAARIWAEREPMPEPIHKRMWKARRKFSRQKNGK